MKVRMGSVSAALRHMLLPQRASRFVSTSSASAHAESEALPPKYENVRKLVVGLGNPGEKFAKTRCVQAAASVMCCHCL